MRRNRKRMATRSDGQVDNVSDDDMIDRMDSALEFKEANRLWFESPSDTHLIDSLWDERVEVEPSSTAVTPTSSHRFNSFFKIMRDLTTLVVLILVTLCGLTSPTFPLELNPSLMEMQSLKSITRVCFDSILHESIASLISELKFMQPCALLLPYLTVLLMFCTSLVFFRNKWFQLLLCSFLVGNGFVLWQETRSSEIQIFAIDPQVAVINRPLSVTFKGMNLDEEGWIVFIRYWACLESQSMEMCLKQTAPSQMNGGLLSQIVFDEVDDYIVCYGDSPIDFKCFPSISLRVRDVKSFPGWSFKV